MMEEDSINLHFQRTMAFHATFPLEIAPNFVEFEVSNSLKSLVE